MENKTTFSDESRSDTLETIIRNIRTHRRTRPVRYNNLLQVQLEIRKQRERLLGTNIPLSSFLGTSEDSMASGIVELTEYLSLRTLDMWRKPHGEHLHFCTQFYELCLACPQWITLDDIILLATTLTHSERTVFKYCMEDLLPSNYHDSLLAFVSDYPADFYEARFEDSVFSAILMLMDIIDEDSVKEGQRYDV